MSSPRNPYELIEQMLERMNRQFDETSRPWAEGLPATGEPGLGRMGIDVADRDEEYVVTADVPGFDREEIELRMLEDVLHVEASQEQSAEEESETYLRSERQHRSLSEHVRLPDPVVAEDVEATLQNGVLTITLPKAEPDDSGGSLIDIQ